MSIKLTFVGSRELDVHVELARQLELTRIHERSGANKFVHCRSGFGQIDGIVNWIWWFGFGRLFRVWCWSGCRFGRRRSVAANRDARSAAFPHLSNFIRNKIGCIADRRCARSRSGCLRVRLTLHGGRTISGTGFGDKVRIGHAAVMAQPNAGWNVVLVKRRIAKNKVFKMEWV